MAFEEYRGRCIGRALHFMYAVDMRADEATFAGDGKTVTLRGKPYCTYEWEENTDTPKITYADPLMQSHADQTVQRLVQWEEERRKMTGDEPWLLDKCIEYRKAKEQYRAERFRNEFLPDANKTHPVKPEPNAMYDQHYAV